jgi:hypothetical protein
MYIKFGIINFLLIVYMFENDSIHSTHSTNSMNSTDSKDFSSLLYTAIDITYNITPAFPAIADVFRFL